MNPAVTWCWVVVLLVGIASGAWLGFTAHAGTTMALPLMSVLGTGVLAATLVVAVRPGGLTPRPRRGRVNN